MNCIPSGSLFRIVTDWVFVSLILFDFTILVIAWYKSQGLVVGGSVVAVVGSCVDTGSVLMGMSVVEGMVIVVSSRVGGTVVGGFVVGGIVVGGFVVGGIVVGGFVVGGTVVGGFVVGGTVVGGFVVGGTVIGGIVVGGIVVGGFVVGSVGGLVIVVTASVVDTICVVIRGGGVVGCKGAVDGGEDGRYKLCIQ